MSRVEDIRRAIETLKSEAIEHYDAEEMKAAMLAHIAVSLAVIADKLTEGSEE